MANGIEINLDPVCKLREAIATFEQECSANEGYLPSIATLLRIYADELAEKYPDDINRGAFHD